MQAVQHEVQHAVFKFHHTISSHPQRNLRARRWRRAINSALATANLRNDEENNGSSS